MATQRLVLAVALAPLSALLAIAMMMIVFAVAFDHRPFEVALNFQFFAFFGLPIAYATTIVLGIPVHLILRLLKKASVLNHALTGALLGLAFALVVFGRKSLLFEDPILTLTYGGLMVLPGATVAAVFGAIARRTSSASGVANAT